MAAPSNPFCFRPGLDLGSRIDAAASARGMKRSEWLVWAVEQALDNEKGSATPGQTGQLVRARVDPASESSAPAGPPASGQARADAFRAASLRRLGR